MVLKVGFFVLPLFIFAALAYQPGCRTRYEIPRKWMDQDSSTIYWECVKWGKSEKRTCPKDTKFSEPFQTCVPSQFWSAVPYYPPPSNAEEEYEDACGYIEAPSKCNSEVHVYCGMGVYEHDKGYCHCYDGAIYLDGVCVHHTSCSNQNHSQYPDKELEGSSTTSSPCVNGYSLNGVCVCDDYSVLHDGICVPKDYTEAYPKPEY